MGDPLGDADGKGDHRSVGAARSAVNPDVMAAARALRLDRVAAVAVDRLRAARIPSILLKGATIATWLYDDGQLRPYRDVDLLVSPSDADRAKEVLAELGYVHTMEGAHPGEVGPKEQELFGPEGVCIDLHVGFLGMNASLQRCWDVLVRRTQPFRLGGGAEVQVLDIPARALHLALHAAQNGPIDAKAVADLERGLTRVDVDQWRAAARLAEELEASEAFAAGLRLLPAGAALADELGLTRRMTVELALRTRSAPQNAIFFERLTKVPGVRKKGALLARKLFPTAVWMRANSDMARQGRLGLVCAWLAHPVSVLKRLPAALVAWLAARRATRGLS